MTAPRVIPETHGLDDADSIPGCLSPSTYQRTAARSEFVIGAPGYVAQLRAAGFEPRRQRRVRVPLLASGIVAVAAVAAGVGVAVSQDTQQITFALVPSEAAPAALVVSVDTGTQPEGTQADETATETTSRAEAELSAADSDVAAASQPEESSVETPAPTPAPALPAPTPSPAAPPPAPPKPPLSEAEFRTIALAAGWPVAVLDELVAVAMCESDLRPGAVGVGTYGLMQLVPWWFEASGVPFDSWADPLANLKASLYLYTLSKDSGTSGWHHWGCKP